MAIKVLTFVFRCDHELVCLSTLSRDPSCFSQVLLRVDVKKAEMGRIKPVNFLVFNVSDGDAVEKTPDIPPSRLDFCLDMRQTTSGVNSVERFDETVETGHNRIVSFSGPGEIMEQSGVQKRHITGNDDIMKRVRRRKSGIDASEHAATRENIGGDSDPLAGREERNVLFCAGDDNDIPAEPAKRIDDPGQQSSAAHFFLQFVASQPLRFTSRQCDRTKQLSSPTPPRGTHPFRKKHPARIFRHLRLPLP
jgi:hypothetical protein